MLGKKRLISVIASLMLVIAMLPSAAAANTVCLSMATAASGNWTDPGNYDITWYTDDTSKSQFEISSAKDLAGLAVLTNRLNGAPTAYFNKKTIKLTKDIDLSGHYWTPIKQDSSVIFDFDGDGNTISGLTCESSSVDNVGLIGEWYWGTVKNLTLADVNIDETSGASVKYVGGIIGKVTGLVMSVENCKVTSGIISGKGYVGGIVGYGTYNITKCSNAATVNGFIAGGIIGNNEQTTITKCTNTGAVSAIYANPEDATAIPMAGGIAGKAVDDDTFSGCSNSGDITAFVSGLDCLAGGIVGSFSGYGKYIVGCSNSGSVFSSYTAGGIAGDMPSGGFLDICYNTGAITGSNYAGGLVGRYNYPTGDTWLGIQDSYSMGAVSASKAGGIVGLFEGESLESGESKDNRGFSQAYYLKGTASKAAGDCKNTTGENYVADGDDPTEIENSVLESGEIDVRCPSYGGYMFAQNIDNDKDVDSHPMIVEEGDFSEHAKVYTCALTLCDNTVTNLYSNTEFESSETRGHKFAYVEDNDKIKAVCSICFKEATATLVMDSKVKASDVEYTGAPVTPITVEYNDLWISEGLPQDLEVKYKDNVNAGTATATVTHANKTASLDYTIHKQSSENRDAPNKVIAVGESSKGANDGVFRNVDDTMEYRTDSELIYTAVSGDSVGGLAPGTYYIRYKETNNSQASKDVQLIVGEGSEVYSSKNFVRYYGPTRYDTSLETAAAVKENLAVDKYDTVVITSGEGFADALSGAYLADLKDAPIIGVNSATETKVENYVKGNLTEKGTVYILGGVGAVSQKMEDALKADGYKVKRLGGATRYDTNLEILKECDVKDQDVLVCSGNGYADSLSASAAGRPILLVNTSITADQKDYLDDIKIKKMYIIGGTGAVNSSVEESAKTYGDVTRLGGATRYETSVMVAEEFFPDDCNSLVLAYGQNFPDGLSGGPLALSLDAPLILTTNDKANYTEAAEFARKKSVQNVVVLGGTTLISDETVQRILG